MISRGPRRPTVASGIGQRDTIAEFTSQFTGGIAVEEVGDDGLMLRRLVRHGAVTGPHGFF